MTAPRWTGAVLALLFAMGPACAGQPRRVLSLNLCTDQLVLALAPPESVIGVTAAARDCRYSAACREAGRVPAVRGGAEEVVALHPDLVLAGETGGREAIAIARRLGVATLVLPSAGSLEAVRDQIGRVASALGREGRGAELQAAFDGRLAAIPIPAGPLPVAAVYEPNGFTAGPGSLADAVLGRAGLANYARQQRIGSTGAIPLELLVANRPALLITDVQHAAPSLAEAMLWHPVVRDAFEGRRVEVPASAWICGSPATLDALDRLVRARLALPP